MSTRPLISQRDSGVRAWRSTRASLLALELGLSAIDLYLVVLLAAAARASRRVPERDPGDAPQALRFVVLVPAHDEERVIGVTLAAVDRTTYPRDRWRTVVIADNCSDLTAQVAAGAGAEVMERHDPGRRGKGHALNWALERLHASTDEHDAIAILDADCLPDANWLGVLGAHLVAGAPAVQASYVVANPSASPQTALRAAGFALMNTVRPMGKERLRLSSGLLGTGMAFRREVLERHPFHPESLVEDSDLHLRLVAAGMRVSFASEVAVSSPIPTARSAVATQQRRWEGGRAQLIRDWTPSLLALGLRRRDRIRIHAALEPLVPPQSVLGLAHVGLGALAAVADSPATRRLAILNAGMQALFVLGGLRVARVPRSVYAALPMAPVLVARKARLLVGLIWAGAPTSWERTQRDND